MQGSGWKTREDRRNCGILNQDYTPSLHTPLPLTLQPQTPARKASEKGKRQRNISQREKNQSFPARPKTTKLDVSHERDPQSLYVHLRYILEEEKGREEVLKIMNRGERNGFEKTQKSGEEERIHRIRVGYDPQPIVCSPQPIQCGPITNPAHVCSNVTPSLAAHEPRPNRPISPDRNNVTHSPASVPRTQASTRASTRELSCDVPHSHCTMCRPAAKESLSFTVRLGSVQSFGSKTVQTARLAIQTQTPTFFYLMELI